MVTYDYEVLVIGAGVAGLQAIASARRLGAVVQAYDVRPVVREQVESLGAKFIELDIETEGAEDGDQPAAGHGEPDGAEPEDGDGDPRNLHLAFHGHPDPEGAWQIARDDAARQRQKEARCGHGCGQHRRVDKELRVKPGIVGKNEDRAVR